ncbi:DUF4232 domain-containing protein [Streptomyces triticiradicis]|uniref:DUF4232 domain-containing protein n=1 Tax=Streptomyces triticiradicis TaxID=2651189 RepID=A0A7J5D733_9ACTN|nr:DUF4232 domain-containing protein [Streptomyces triticiradicis]KAB1981208.1 DUF4232 domain-containing protein [Streptomyces triticiradicis]
MRATTRLAAGSAVLTAALAVTACGHTTAQPHGATSTTGSVSPSGGPSPARSPAECRTASLTWALVLLPERTGGRRDARLTVANDAPETCLFAGYPGFSVHNGKANSIEGVGHGHPRTIALRKGTGVTVDLRYTPRGAKGAGDYCVTENEALVSAPHDPDSDRVNVPVMEAHHKAAEIDACGDSVSMSLPRYTPHPRVP